MKILIPLKALFFTIFLILATAVCAQANVVHLLSGEILQGEIVSRDDEMISIDTGLGIPLTYFMDEIDTIDGVPVTPEPLDETPATPEAPEVNEAVKPAEPEIEEIVVEDVPEVVEPEQPIAPVIVEPEAVEELEVINVSEPEPIDDRAENATEGIEGSESAVIEEPEESRQPSKIFADLMQKIENENIVVQEPFDIPAAPETPVKTGTKKVVPAEVKPVKETATLDGVEVFKEQLSPAAIKPKEAASVAMPEESVDIPERQNEEIFPKKIVAPPPVNKQVERAVSRGFENFLQNRQKDFQAMRSRWQSKLSAIKDKLYQIPVKVRHSMLMLFIIFGTASYFLTCLPLMLIAGKLEKKHIWLIWVPVVQLFYFVHISGRRLWWTLMFLVPFFNIVFPIFLFVDILKALKKPLALIVLLILPGANIIMLWYLAFSKRINSNDNTIRMA